MNKGILIGGLLAIGVTYLALKGSSLKNMVDKLTITPKLGGKLRLKTGSGNFFEKLVNTVTGSAYLEVPISVDFTNRSDEELTVSVQSVVAYLKNKSVAESKPSQSSVRITKYSTSTLEGIKLTIPTTTLVSVMGSAIESYLANGNFDEIVNNLKIKIGATLNNTFVFNITLELGKSGEVDTTLKTTISGLGLAASSKRNIRPISDYIQYIPDKSNLLRQDKIVKVDGSVYDTVDIMHQAAKLDKENVRELANRLKRGTVKDTLQSIFDFVYQHIDYVKDNPYIEQVRRPLRTLYDQKGDCDCYATLIASMLECLEIPYKFRIAMYQNGYYQHVYVVVPTVQGMLVVDPVLDKCFTEKPTVKHEDL